LPNRQLHAFSLLSLETSLARFSSPHHYPELCLLPSGKIVHGSLSLDLHDFHPLSFLIGLGEKWAVAYPHDIIFLNAMTTVFLKKPIPEGNAIWISQVQYERSCRTCLLAWGPPFFVRVPLAASVAFGGRGIGLVFCKSRKLP
jgi:hypothetical protein